MSPSNATVRSLAERRVRRQKIFIAVGSVILLAVLGFQLPKLLGGKGGPTAVPHAVTTVSGAAAPAATPAVPAGQLPSDRVVVQRDANQLISFGLFKTKDPFVPQVTTTTSTTPSSPPEEPPTSTTTSTEATPPVVPVGTPPTPSPSSPSSTTPGATTPSAPTAPPAVATEALIATNGVCERVAVNGTFPVTENIFRLVSIAKDGKSVQVGIVGGSFDSGQSTATLKLGDKLTLVNTADGTRYVIELKAKCADIATQPGATQTTPPTTTSPQSVPITPVIPAPTPTTTTTDTVTTPIVTDADDTTTTTPSS
jgi:hypothetical protein